MYNDIIKAENKIISYNDLLDIFNQMYEELEKYKKISHSEEIKNRTLDYDYQEWSFKDSGSNLKFKVDFYDDTNIEFDSYSKFITIFNNRLEEIKQIYVSYYLHYSTSNKIEKSNYHSQHISMFIKEDKIDLNISMEHNSEMMLETYNLIKSKLQHAPEKYDNIVRNRNSITSTVGTAIAFIPSITICTIILFIPKINEMFTKSFVLYPIICCLITFMLSGALGANKLGDLYKNIIPDKKYISYEKGYKDDIEKYTSRSEILIGKNIHNLENRKQINNIYTKYKKYIPYEIVVLILFSFIAIIMGIVSK